VHETKAKFHQSIIIFSSIIHISHIVSSSHHSEIMLAEKIKPGKTLLVMLPIPATKARVTGIALESSAFTG
jgi:hypothetical protein